MQCKCNANASGKESREGKTCIVNRNRNAMNDSSTEGAVKGRRERGGSKIKLLLQLQNGRT